VSKRGATILEPYGCDFFSKPADLIMNTNENFYSEFNKENTGDAMHKYH
jgi:hypothetical protein